MEGLTPYQEYMENLRDAHIYTEKALNALYGPKRVKRGWMYRWALGRAQNALITLYVRELDQPRDIDGNKLRLWDV